MRNRAYFLTPIILLLATNSVQAELAETEVAGVSAEVAELRQAGGALRLVVRYANSGTKAADFSRFSAGKIVLVDVKSRQKYFPIKDANNQWVAGPIGDEIEGGRLRLSIPPGQETFAWAYFEPLAAGTVVSVELPQMFPFEDIPVTEGAQAVLHATTAQSTPVGAVASLVSAKRADEALKVRLKLGPQAGRNADIGPYFEYKQVYLFDPAGKRKYPLLKDAEGIFVAQPLGQKMGGGTFIIDASKTTLVSLTLQAPPDSVTSADLVLPWFLPFENLTIEGLGGAAAGGVAAAGKSIGLEGALKELAAVVTPEEIKIDLSADVLFDFDKADLKPVAEEKLNHLLTVVNSRPNFAVLIEGHTDVRGDAAYNQALSQRRADAVRIWLTSHGVAADRLNATGAGESRPLRSGDTEEDHQANRRVEIRMTGPVAEKGASPQTAIQLQPGNWRLHVVSTVNGVAEPTQDTEACISAEELSDLGSYFAPDLEGAEADCKKTRQPSADPGLVAYQMSCTGSSFTVEMATQVAIESSTRFGATLKIDSRTETEYAHVEGQADANWASECNPDPAIN